MKDSFLRILLVESSSIDAQVIKAMLAAVWEDGLTLDRQALVVKHAETLAMALGMLRKNAFDLILLDLFLPDGEGLSVFSQVQELASETATIILTAINDRALALSAVRQGAQDYLVKSHLNIEALGHSASHALERQVMLSELRGQRQELEASERRLRTIIATNADGLMVLDQEGFVRFANASAANLFGVEALRLQGSYFGRPAENMRMTEIGILGSQQAQSMAAMRAVPIEWEGAQALLLSVRDITERVRAEAAIQGAYREKEQLISAIASILIGVSIDGTITAWNQVAEEVLGVHAADALGHKIEDCSIQWDMKIILGAVIECYTQHEPVRVDDVLFQRQDGTPGFLGMTLNPMIDAEGQQTGFLIAGRDITEPKRMRAELEQARLRELRMKDQFLSHVSHELRTPLYAIYQFISILQDGLAGELNEEQHEYLDIVSRNADQLQTMINDLLDLTRAQTGKLNIEPQEMALDELIGEIVRTMGLRGASKELSIVDDIADELPQIHADPSRVREVLSNLIDNAIKFTPAQGRITVKATQDEVDPEFVLVSIADTGVGIAPEEQKAIFGYLYQGTEASEFSRKGMGIGLYLCQELVTRQGGRIWVESKQGQGSTFYFTLPVAKQTVSLRAGEQVFGS